MQTYINSLKKNKFYFKIKCTFVPEQKKITMLKNKILEKLRTDKVLIAKIAESRCVDYQTVERWVATNHENLLNIFTLKLISEELDVDIHSIYSIKN